MLFQHILRAIEVNFTTSNNWEEMLYNRPEKFEWFHFNFSSEVPIYSYYGSKMQLYTLSLWTLPVSYHVCLKLKTPQPNNRLTCNWYSNRFYFQENVVAEELHAVGVPGRHAEPAAHLHQQEQLNYILGPK